MLPHLRKRFGQRVRELRLKRGMLQGDLAHKVGIRESFVSDIERAKKEPCLEVIGMIAKALDVSLRQLFWKL